MIIAIETFEMLVRLGFLGRGGTTTRKNTDRNCTSHIVSAR
jgi:hypothetical protein